MKMLKTRMCTRFPDCIFGEGCHFAHSERELRGPIREKSTRSRWGPSDDDSGWNTTWGGCAQTATAGSNFNTNRWAAARPAYAGTKGKETSGGLPSGPRHDLLHEKTTCGSSPPAACAAGGDEPHPSEKKLAPPFPRTSPQTRSSSFSKHGPGSPSREEAAPLVGLEVELHEALVDVQRSLLCGRLNPAKESWAKNYFLRKLGMFGDASPRAWPILEAVLEEAVEREAEGSAAGVAGGGGGELPSPKSLVRRWRQQGLIGEDEQEVIGFMSGPDTGAEILWAEAYQ